MCGILGVALREGAPVRPALHGDLDQLFLISESRGKEAAGVAVCTARAIEVFKCASPASRMIRAPGYRRIVAEAFAEGALRPGPRAAIGHSRLVTTGGLQRPENNQPVVAGGGVAVHNGIVVNHEDIFRAHPGLVRRGDVDSEAIVALLRLHWEASGDLAAALRAAFAEIDGTVSTAVLFADADALLLATNNGSLYACVLPGGDELWFASEGRFLARLPGTPPVARVAPGRALVVDLRTLDRREVDLLAKGVAGEPLALARIPTRSVQVTAAEAEGGVRLADRRVGLGSLLDDNARAYLDSVQARFPHNTSWQDSLRRCTRCVLPETMPFISFDAEGVCSYCRGYRRVETLGREALLAALRRRPPAPGAPDCVVGVSGGRDSLYTLHCLRRELGLSPVAFTYDWGMVTDLARRNTARICGRLGVEHVVISADIARKRRNIRDNLTVWLRRPRLGLIPLFMAGDKQYFHYLREVRRATGAPVAVMGENMLERTDFKTGFAGVAPHRDPNHVYTLTWGGKARLAAFYAGNYLANPGYLNASLADTAWAFLCYFALARDYLNFYKYVPWEEERVVATLRREYDFELAADSPTTWRIGDGTAAFYNYVFYTVAGFTENEALRSNQVREGVLTREEAMRRVRIENAPRYETIYWYLDVIGLGIPMHEVLRIIHAMPRVQPGEGAAGERAR